MFDPNKIYIILSFLSPAHEVGAGDIFITMSGGATLRCRLPFVVKHSLHLPAIPT